ERVRLSLVRQCHHRKVIVVDDLNPLLLDAVERVLKHDAFLVRQLPCDLPAPLTKTSGAALEYSERQQKLFGLGVERLAGFCPFGGGALMKDRLLEVGPILKLAEVEEVTVLANSVEGLIERSQPLLAVENEESVLGAVEHRRAFKLARGEYPLGVAH